MHGSVLSLESRCPEAGTCPSLLLLPEPHEPTAQDISPGGHRQQTQPVSSNISFTRNKGDILSPLPFSFVLLLIWF